MVFYLIWWHTYCDSCFKSSLSNLDKCWKLLELLNWMSRPHSVDTDGHARIVRFTLSLKGSSIGNEYSSSLVVGGDAHAVVDVVDVAPILEGL